MFDTLLIANRGAIACRILRSARRLGLRTVAVYSEADRHAAHVLQADTAICLGPAPAAQSYLDPDKLLAAARDSGAQALHPGYGFLSENPDFAAACEAAGIAFVGPTPQQMRDFGLKHTARALAEAAGVPLLPGSGLLDDLAHARREAARIGYPVMLKSTAGGGGIGMRLVESDAELDAAFAAVDRLARANFKAAGLFLEKFVRAARHIEVQIFGDGQGGVVHLGERECSLQRRNQKVVEETPAPRLDPATRQALCDTAVALAKTVHYRNAGTVEYVLDADTGAFYFLEVNTRLQVEHGVSEEVSGVDLVEWMLRLAAGDNPIAGYVHAPRGHSIQTRLYAEDPARGFQPSAGLLTRVEFPPAARIETWVETGTEVSAWYDPMLAKLIVHGDDREAALAQLDHALAATRIDGIATNLAYLRQIARHPPFVSGQVTTRTLDGLTYQAQAIAVLAPGVQSTIQDWPGRVGYWAVGVPPSGPMDARAHRLANRLLGNDAAAATLEITLAGPTLRFHSATRFVLAGATMHATLDGVAVDFHRVHAAAAGSVLAIGALVEHGCRAYLAVAGGFDVPPYLASRATFTLGQFGGHAGRALRAGDMLPLGADAATDCLPVDAVAGLVPVPTAPGLISAPTAPSLIPVPSAHWEIGVLYGPHGAPDFFTDADIATFFATDWEIHHNSSRTGVRLIGPKPVWARSDGGEAGLHPSNLHDNAYAIGAIDFTGDMPVILGPDGPSLGGFVCPAVIVDAELWKVGQLRPGNTVRFVRLSEAEARARSHALTASLSALAPVAAADRIAPGPANDAPGHANDAFADAIIVRRDASAAGPAVVIRRAGDRYLLVEYGAMVLDLELRFRVHALMLALQTRALPGVLDLTPGIRSLQVHYDPEVLPLAALLDQLDACEAQLAAIDDMEVESRIVHLPLSWDDPATRLAIEKYTTTVRPDAPWCPSNIEFIRRINGLDSIEDVQRIVFDASYLVMGLGDVYLGAPVATPLDPRHRLVTTKYNPARTWTPENAVGIGGAYLCVYGMEGPGGYQFVGRTVQMWNRWKSTADFPAGTPWLLRFFDQIRFHPVSEAELAELRRDFPHGRAPLKIEPARFRLADYRAFLAAHADSIQTFKARQQQAFDAERARWEAAGLASFDPDTAPVVAEAAALPDGCEALASPLAGSVWKWQVAPGRAFKAGEPLLLLEAMKMEVPVNAPFDGELVEARVSEGQAVQAGQMLAVLRPV